MIVNILIALAIFAALPLVLVASLAFTFIYGAEPWDKKQYKIVGALHAVSAILFGALFVIDYLMIRNFEHWFWLILPAIFAFLSWKYWRKTKPRT